VGIHVVKRATRFEALEPIRQGVKEYFAGFSAGSAIGLRHGAGQTHLLELTGAVALAGAPHELGGLSFAVAASLLVMYLAISCNLLRVGAVKIKGEIVWREAASVWPGGHGWELTGGQMLNTIGKMNPMKPTMILLFVAWQAAFGQSQQEPRTAARQRLQGGVESGFSRATNPGCVCQRAAETPRCRSRSPAYRARPAGVQ
jgi:hypothetical protein